MELKIAENIKKIRKERNMTQEQLAAAFGVTVGAVSKWESGASVPDIMIIMEMAKFFSTSVDVLLGYELDANEEKYFFETIRNLRNEKRFTEAAEVAQKALQKYPNRFDLVHYCAVLFSLESTETGNKKAFQKSLELYNRAIGLISQNTDKSISEWTIRNEIARLYSWNGKTEKALELLKDNNALGVNNGEIGQLLVYDKKEFKEGLTYLSTALIEHVGQMHLIDMAFINGYEGLGKFDEAVELCEYDVSLLSGFKKPGEVSYYDMEMTHALTALACIYMETGNEEKALEALKRTYASAKEFMSNPTFGFENTKHFYCDGHPTAFDTYGSDAFATVRSILSMQETGSKKLLRMWDEVVENDSSKNH